MSVDVSRRRFLATGVGVAAAPLALAGCSSLSGTATSSASASGAANTTKTLRIGWVSEPDILNPFTFTSSAAFEVLSLIYDTLLEYDLQLRPQPALASSIAYSDGQKTVTYTLRPNITWHDGSPLTADDVKYTFDIIAKNNLGQGAQYLTDLVSTAVHSPTVVSMTYSKPQAFDPALIIPIVPKHIFGPMSVAEIQKDPNKHPIGSGPFTFETWQHGQYVTVNRNAKWWGAAPTAAAVTWVHFDSADVMIQSLVAGQVDALTEVPPLLWDGLKSHQGVTPVEMDSFSFHHIGINVSNNPKSGGNPLLKDLVVRQALGYAVNREQLVSLALAGHGKPGGGILPPAFGNFFYNIPPDKLIDNNPAKGNAILDAAGYKKGSDGYRTAPDGSPLSFRLIAIATTDVDVRAAQLFVASAQQVGIKLTLQTLDETTLGNTVYNASAPNWDIFVWGWDSSTADPDYLLGVPLTSQIGNNNDVYYSNPVYDSLYDQQSTTLNPSARQAIVERMQAMYYTNCAYLIMWYQSKLQAYRSDTWTGWVQVPGGMIYNFTRGNYLGVRPV